LLPANPSCWPNFADRVVTAGTIIAVAYNRAMKTEDDDS